MSNRVRCTNKPACDCAGCLRAEAAYRRLTPLDVELAYYRRDLASPFPSTLSDAFTLQTRRNRREENQ